MLKEEFVRYNLAGRLEMLREQGEAIAEKVYYECNISLVLLGDFYVEIFFNRDLNQIVGAEPQENSQILFDYVKNVDLTELQNLLR